MPVLPRLRRHVLRRGRPLLAGVLLLFVLGLGSGLAPVPAEAGEPVDRDAALRQAFPSADDFVPEDFVLTRDEADRIRELAGTPIASRLLTAWAAMQEGALLGWGLFDTHLVRGHPLTSLVAIEPAGTIGAVRIVAFSEPAAYHAPSDWLDRLIGRRLDDDLWPDRGVDGITGATLTARGLVHAARRQLAVHAVRFADRETNGASAGAPTEGAGRPATAGEVRP